LREQTPQVSVELAELSARLLRELTH
jgi:hypothetical protein